MEKPPRTREETVPRRKGEHVVAAFRPREGKPSIGKTTPAMVAVQLTGRVRNRPVGRPSLRQPIDNDREKASASGKSFRLFKGLTRPDSHLRKKRIISEGRQRGRQGRRHIYPDVAHMFTP